jgi:hypothetical protein
VPCYKLSLSEFLLNQPLATTEAALSRLVSQVYWCPNQFAGTSALLFGTSRRAEGKGLFVAEGLDGIDAGGATGRAESGKERDAKEQDGHASEGERVVGREAVEHGADEAG